MRTKIIFCGAMFAAMWSTVAYAYRPFDGTDAAVTEPGETELELGYLGYLRQGPDRSVVAPSAVFNFGLEKERELVLEGKLNTQLNDSVSNRRTALNDVALSLKQVHRAGVLQDRPGPSVATECGLLLPSLHGDITGATCAAIVSRRWQGATAHFNAAIARNREANWERFLGLILEGRGTGSIRPVLELFSNRIAGGSFTNSALAGLIWQANDALAFDFAWRKAHTEEQGITEIRAGLTWSLPSHPAR